MGKSKKNLIEKKENKEEKTEKVRIENDLSILRNTESVRSEVLLEEITELERRKERALKPIDEIIKKADEKLEEAEQKSKEDDLIRKDVESDKEWLSDKIESITDRETDNVERIKEIERKEGVVKKVELELKSFLKISISP